MQIIPASDHSKELWLNTGKNIASILVIVGFLVMAMGSFGNNSTNTKVNNPNCLPLSTTYEGNLWIVVQFNNYGGTGIAGATGKMFVVHQKVEDTMTCKSLIISQNVIPFTLDQHGHFSYLTETYVHNNSADLFRVEIDIPSKPGSYVGFRETRVATGGPIILRFEHFEPRPLVE